MDIYTYNDLNELIENNTIDTDISIFDDEIKTLEKVEIINGNLGLVSSELETLGGLRLIKGSFVISTTKAHSLLESLENIEEIGGNCWLRFTNIKSLGKLKRVNGNLNLSDTNIIDLGRLEYVGGNLILPTNCKDKIDISNITVLGKLRYKDNEKRIDSNENKLNIVTVPRLKDDFFYKTKVLSDSQNEFFEGFKNAFYSNKYWDLNRNNIYATLLFYDICKIKDITNRNEYLLNLKKEYPLETNSVDEFLIKYYDSINQFEESWNIIQTKTYIQIETIVEYEFKTGKRLVNGDIVKQFVTLDYLTNYGKQNLEDIKLIFNELLFQIENDLNCSFLNQFINPFNSEISLTNYLSKVYDFFVENGKINNSNLDYYKKYFLRENDFKEYLEWDTSRLIEVGKFYELPHLIKKAIVSQLKIILRDSENLLRKRRNMPLIGEGWISETDLFYKIKEEFTNYRVIHGAKPIWLGRQHLDVYIEELNIGLEYQGKQHFEPVDFFGGEESFIKNMERDTRKKQLCEENDCLLIYVLENYEISEIFETIRIRELKNERPPNTRLSSLAG